MRYTFGSFTFSIKTTEQVLREMSLPTEISLPTVFWNADSDRDETPWDGDFSRCAVFCDSGNGTNSLIDERAAIIAAFIENGLEDIDYIVFISGLIQERARMEIEFCLERGAKLLYDARYAGEIARREFEYTEDPTELLRKYETDAIVQDSSLSFEQGCYGDLELRYCGKITDEFALSIAKHRMAISLRWIDSIRPAINHIACRFWDKTGKMKRFSPYASEKSVQLSDILVAVGSDSELYEVLEDFEDDDLGSAASWLVDAKTLEEHAGFNDIQARAQRLETLSNKALENLEEIIHENRQEEICLQAYELVDDAAKELEGVTFKNDDQKDAFIGIRALMKAIGFDTTIAAYDAGVPPEEIF